MLAGGDGILELSDNGVIGRLAANFLIRTRPLWLAQGFAVAIVGSPNNTSLSGQRHTTAYADESGRSLVSLDESQLQIKFIPGQFQ